MTDILAQSVWLVMALILVVSGLASRRLPMKTLIRLLLLWVLIFGIGFLIVLAFQSRAG